MTDPVTNSLALQTQFGDDELKKEIDNHIIELAMAAAHQVVLNAFNNPEYFKRLIVNNNYEFETAVARSMKNFLNNPRNIY
jgi:hypothetical protein